MPKIQRLDLIIIIIIFFSIAGFSLWSPYESIKLENLTIYEGARISDYGRQGNISFFTRSNLNETVNCTFKLEVFQLWRLAAANETSKEVLPGIHENSLSFVIPDGNNKVVLNVNCD